MSQQPTLLQYLELRGVTRREFLGYCAATAAALALPASMASAVAAALGKAQRPSVI